MLRSMFCVYFCLFSVSIVENRISSKIEYTLCSSQPGIDGLRSDKPFAWQKFPTNT